MSVLKFSSGPSAKAAINYFGKEIQGSEEKCIAWATNLALESKADIARAWDQTREEFGKSGGREYYQASFNLDPGAHSLEEITPKKLLEVGEELAEKIAPGHDWAAFVHADKEHPHVHVVWNTVHSETGRKFQHGPKDLERSFRVKDELDLKHGFQTTERSKVLDRISDEAQRIFSRNSEAYLWTEDLKGRIARAKERAENFPLFKGELLKLGVEARERGKEGRLSFSFTDEEGKKRIIRERRLGGQYGREGIERSFRDKGKELKKGYQRETGRAGFGRDTERNEGRIFSGERDS